MPTRLVEAQRTERNAHFGNPSPVVAARAHLPHGVPALVDLAPFQRHLSVMARALHVGAENIAVTPIAERIEQHLKVVLILFLEVLLDVRDQH